jgi:hypothetical protein
VHAGLASGRGSTSTGSSISRSAEYRDIAGVYGHRCSSGGMFVQSEQFVETHGGIINNVSL